MTNVEKKSRVLICAGMYPRSSLHISTVFGVEDSELVELKGEPPTRIFRILQGLRTINKRRDPIIDPFAFSATAYSFGMLHHKGRGRFPVICRMAGISDSDWGYSNAIRQIYGAKTGTSHGKYSRQLICQESDQIRFVPDTASRRNTPLEKPKTE